MNSIAYQFEKWKAALDAFQKNIEKDLSEIRTQKREVQQIKSDIFDRLDKGYFIRDEGRIIISAPEIVIGNVDKSGTLCGGGTESRVIIRSNEVSLEGVGVGATDCGKVTTRATQIHHIAVDPGIDGLENVVQKRSEVVSQARNIILQSNKSSGTFPTPVSTAIGTSGVTIHATDRIELNASLPCETLKKSLETQQKGLKAQIEENKKRSTAAKKTVDSHMKSLELILKGLNLNSNEIFTRVNQLEIEKLHAKFESLTVALSESMSSYFASLSEQAETNRCLKSVEEQQKAVDTLKSTYKEESTQSAIVMQSEIVNIVSKDGDGNLRTNPEAGVNILAKQINLATQAADGSLAKESSISLASEKVTLSTINSKWEKEKADLPATGDVRIVSKNILLESVDYEHKDKKLQEKALTKGGGIRLRAENIQATASDTEGKATGRIALNAKAVEVKSMDVDKEKRSDKSLAAGSSMLLLSEKMFVGSKSKKEKSKSLQLVSDKVGTFGTNTVELQQGEAKGIVQLEGGNVSLSGSKTELYGETTLQGKSTFKADVVMGKAEMKNLEVKTSFKTPCTSEGIPSSSPPFTAKLSAKLAVEDAPASV